MANLDSTFIGVFSEMLKEQAYLDQESYDIQKVLLVMVGVAFILLVPFTGSIFLTIVILSLIMISFPVTQLIYTQIWRVNYWGSFNLVGVLVCFLIAILNATVFLSNYTAAQSLTDKSDR